MEFINYLMHIKYSYVFVSVFVILTCTKMVISLIEWIAQNIGLETRGMRRQRETQAKLKAHEKQIEKLDEKYDLLIDKIDRMVTNLDNHIEDSKLDNQAIVRDNISRFYRYIKSSKHQYILDQDLQNYISMFDRYSKDHGNGYVHDIVDPYMRSLPVFLSTEQAEEYFNEK